VVQILLTKLRYGIDMTSSFSLL